MFQRLAAQAQLRQTKARAEGTNQNRISAVTGWLKFCYAMAITPAAARPYHICMYLEVLEDRDLTPPTIRNHLGHIRIYLRLAPLPPVANHPRVSWAMEAILRRKDYQPVNLSPTQTPVIVRVIVALPITQDHVSVKAAILMMIYAALRQSEVIPPTKGAFDPQRHLNRADVVFFSCFFLKSNFRSSS